MVIESLGCILTANTTVEWIGNSNVFIPNVFSPNGDNINDFFIPQVSPEITIIDELLIFDRWGNMVFKAENIPPNSIESGWNGRYKNQALNPAVFIYWVKITDLDGNSSFYKGNVTLIR